MGARRGAVELGLQVEWKWDFLGPGSVVQTRADTVALDLGNRLAPGVLDQHQDASVGRSTADLVLRRDDLVYDHLMQPWLNRADDGQDLNGRPWRPTLVTHRAPDFDGIVAALLCMELVEHGGFPSWADSLVAVASSVDQGRVSELGIRDVNPNSIFYAFYVFSREMSDEERALRGMKLIRHEAEALSALLGRPLRVSDWLGESAGAWVEMDDASRSAGEILANDRATYEKELADGMHQRRSVELPCLEGRAFIATIEVDAMVTRVGGEPRRYSQSRLLKYWVRQSGVPLMVCPRDNRGQHTVTISLDPIWTDGVGRSPSLAGLGYALERAEVKAREAAGGDERLKQPRWKDGTVDNDDPWYDGRGHDHTIVESPRSGTALSDREIEEIVTGGRWGRPAQPR